MTRRALTFVPFVLFASMVSPAAQQPAPSMDGPQSGDSTTQDKKQNKNQGAPEGAVVSTSDEGTAFDERAAAAVLGVIRNGLEAHSQRLLLSAFAADKMNGYLTFQDQIAAYYTRYEAFRVTIRIIQTSEENNRGVILAEFQLESEPRGGGQISRRESQLRFELERGSTGWKVVDFNPRGFFS